jgi:hypothetical protein
LGRGILTVRGNCPLQSLYFDRAPEQIVRSSALSPTVPPTLFVRADEVIE